MLIACSAAQCVTLDSSGSTSFARLDMQVVFRTDASLDIGTGHVMRCLTLAQALREQGAVCRFISRAHTGHLAELVRLRGFEIDLLNKDIPALASGSPDDTTVPHANWLGTHWAVDAYQTKATLIGAKIDCMVVDHYALDSRWELEMKAAGISSLVAIDDLADRSHTCDLLIDQNLGRAARDYAGLVPTGCKMLIGAQYAMLLPIFAELRSYSLERRREPSSRHVLITLGGVDKNDLTSQVLTSLRHCALPADGRITVVMGANAPHLQKARELASAMPWPTDVQTNVQHMAQLIANSDISIGAAGATSWERCCLGVPSVLVVLADNQRQIAQALDHAGAAIILENSILDQQLRTFFAELAQSLARLRALSQAAAVVTDGKGVAKVRDAVLALRRAS
jgi:UDP-2,4-diacetamido-2,4,6-trideoxy-beta-L-altropyranose hydrolase